MSLCKEKIKATLLNYLSNTSVHGISHAEQALSKRQRAFWIIIFFMGFICCSLHVMKSVKDYQETPITSTLFFYEELFEFPDITFCSLSPVSQAIYRLQNQTLKNHLKKQWNYFQSWFSYTLEDLKLQNMTDLELRLLYKDALQINLEMFWASDAAREFGRSDYTLSSIYCKFNGKMCSTKDFKLIQTNDYWNCYTYIPPQRVIAKSQKDAALEIIVFTDSSTEMIDPDNITYVRLASDLKMQEHYEKYSINEIWNDPYGDGSAEGIRVFIHNADEYPLFSSQYFDIPSGVHANIQVSQTIYKKYKTRQNPCNLGEPLYVNYVRAFDRNATSVIRKQYRKTQATVVNSYLQNTFYKKCGCYSHKLPFECNITDLCVYVPPEDRFNGNISFMIRANCHFMEYSTITKESNFFDKENEKFEMYEPCETRRFEAFLSKCPWPKAQDMTELINLIVLPSLTKSINDTNRHHICKFDDTKVASVLVNDAALRAIIDSSNCDPQNITGNVGKTKKDYWCTTADKIRDNLAYITIKPEFPAANKYEESQSKSFPEILGELGGTMGLWLGVSLLSFIEIVELFFLCCFRNPEKEPTKDEDENLPLEQTSAAA